MWTYHAVADVVLAHSLVALAAGGGSENAPPLPGSVGVAISPASPPGSITGSRRPCQSTAAGFSTTTACGTTTAHPRKWTLRRGGCGSGISIRASTWRGPLVRSCFLNGSNDFAYPLDSYRKTIEQVKPELATVAIHHKLKHGHYLGRSKSSMPSSIRSCATAKKLARVGELRVSGKDCPRADPDRHTSRQRRIMVHERSRASGSRASGRWFPARSPTARSRAELPEDRPIAFFLQAVDERGLRTSSTHASLVGSNAGSNHAVVPTPKLEQDFYDWHRRHAEMLRIKHEVDPEIVLIGDSITHMWGGLPAEPGRARGAKSWDALFGERALNLGFGWDRTQNVLWRIDHGELDGLNPKLVVIHIGTNNLAGHQEPQGRHSRADRGGDPCGRAAGETQTAAGENRADGGVPARREAGSPDAQTDCRNQRAAARDREGTGR